MKRLIVALVFSSGFLFAQNNIALLHPDNFSSGAIAPAVEAVVEIPFELINGMVIVRASVNDEEGNFLLDTGSPGIVLNARADECNNVQNGAGVGGKVELGEVELKSFIWGQVRRENVMGLTLNIDHLEAACGRSLMGLIGFEVLQHYEILFDYRNQIVRLYRSGQAEDFRPGGSRIEVPFTLCGHVPVVKMKIGDKKAVLGIDSGAEANLLDRSYYDHLLSGHVSNLEMETLTGLDQRRITVLAADVSHTHVRRQDLSKMRYLFLELDELNKAFGWNLDGLLGYPFFANHQVAINYEKKRLYIWD